MERFSMVESATPRDIPLPIQREIRQRCGFGCVMCGNPLYDYHHMEGWSASRPHIASQITLLCDNHHREATSGLLPKARVLEADSNPHNLKTGQSTAHLLHFSGSQCEVSIGGNLFTARWQGEFGEMVPVMIDGTPIIGFSFDRGFLLLTCQIFDEANNLIMFVRQNQLVYSSAPWDIQFISRTLTIRQAAREILITVTFDPPNRIIIEKARLLRNGVELLIDSDGVLIVNNHSLIQRCVFGNCQVGLLMGMAPPGVGAGFALPGLNRYLGDREAAKKWAASLK
jgi:trigger factor